MYLNPENYKKIIVEVKMHFDLVHLERQSPAICRSVQKFFFNKCYTCISVVLIHLSDA